MNSKIMQTTVEVSGLQQAGDLDHVWISTEVGSFYISSLQLTRHELSKKVTMSFRFFKPADRDYLITRDSRQLAIPYGSGQLEIQRWVQADIATRGLNSTLCKEGRDSLTGDFELTFNLGTFEFVDLAVDLIKSFWKRFALHSGLLERHLKIYYTPLVWQEDVGYSTLAHKMLANAGLVNAIIVEYLCNEVMDETRT